MSNWIKCSERMPTYDGRYLVYSGKIVSIASCQKLKSIDEMRFMWPGVTHWQELPKEPSE